MKNIGDIINSRWKVTKPLTSDSGQAHTYKVLDLHNENDNTEYVIKLLKKVNDKSLARFKREVEASLTLDHPNIVHVIDADYQETSEPYLVMEFCNGGELEPRKIKHLTLIEKLKMFEAICVALAHAHAQDRVVIHRDLKPRNIFLRDSKGKIPVVGDFGICFFEESESDERLTELREQVGAKSFRPPEAEFGIIEEVNPSFDIYSLGKLLYWFLSNGDIPVREHYKHPKFDLRKDESEQAIHLVYEIFDKSIREEPTERYRNATEMYEDLWKLIEFVESDARYLDCNIPQKCIFCRIGTYEFVRSPDISGGKFNYSKSMAFGIDIKNYDGHSLHERPSNVSTYTGLLIGHCKNCGNVQHFRIDFSMNDDRTYSQNTNWKSLPDTN